MVKACWATLLATDNYLYGVIGLYYRLKYLKSKFPLIVLIPQNGLQPSTITILQTLNIEIIEYTPVKFSGPYINIGCANCEITINKFQIFHLMTWDKICFIDADIIPIKNLDFLLINDKEYFTMALTGLLSGGIFSIHPNNKIWEKILIEYASLCNNDEQVLGCLYTDIAFKTQCFIYQDNKLFFHWGGSPKWWEKGRFNIQSIKQIENLMQGITCHILIYGPNKYRKLYGGWRQ